MKYVIIDTERKMFLKAVSLNLYSYGNMRDIPCGSTLESAYQFMSAEAAVHMAGFLNSIEENRKYMAVSSEDISAMKVLLRN